MKTIGIAAHSFEGGALCFLTACREGAARLGAHMHPPIVMSAIPMGLALPAWESGNHAEIGGYLAQGVRRVAAAGADFYICPDNTAHIVLEKIAHEMPIPGLHIADVVCREIAASGWKLVGLLGTKWTMTGPVYENALRRRGMERILPDTTRQTQVNAAIFEELCQSVFRQETVNLFLAVIQQLKDAGAECVILGCTEIPLIVNSANSPLPVLDSTRLLAQRAVELALSEAAPPAQGGWIQLAPLERTAANAF